MPRVDDRPNEFRGPEEFRYYGPSWQRAALWGSAASYLLFWPRIVLGTLGATRLGSAVEDSPPVVAITQWLGIGALLAAAIVGTYQLRKWRHGRATIDQSGLTVWHVSGQPWHVAWDEVVRLRRVRHYAPRVTVVTSDGAGTHFPGSFIGEEVLIDQIATRAGLVHDAEARWLFADDEVWVRRTAATEGGARYRPPTRRRSTARARTVSGRIALVNTSLLLGTMGLFWLGRCSSVEDAVAQHDVPRLNLFLFLGADPDGRQTVQTPLHSAVIGGDTGMARILLEAGADPDGAWRPGSECTPSDKTPLVAAIRRGDADSVQLLLSFGADPWLAAEDVTEALKDAPDEVRLPIVGARSRVR